MVIAATYYGSNGWLVEFNQTRILIDPWLRGDLVFQPGPWLIKGTLNQQFIVPTKIDLILLTWVDILMDVLHQKQRGSTILLLRIDFATTSEDCFIFSSPN